MNAAARHIQEVIMGNPAISALLTGDLYWELAPEDTEYPFGVYSITQEPGPTKDSPFGYTAELRLFGESITDAALIADTVMNELRQDAGNRWRFINADSGYTDTDAKTGFIRLTYSFKLTNT